MRPWRAVHPSGRLKHRRVQVLPGLCRHLRLFPPPLKRLLQVVRRLRRGRLLPLPGQLTRPASGL